MQKSILGGITNEHARTFAVEKQTATKPLPGKLERVEGIEPSRSAWEADKLPLHHTRATSRYHGSAAMVKRSMRVRLERRAANAYLLVDQQFSER